MDTEHCLIPVSSVQRVVVNSAHALKTPLHFHLHVPVDGGFSLF